MKSLQERIDEISWWHHIDLNGIVTPGKVDPSHCTEESATNRFGIPENLIGKTVLDIGCNNGYFSFLAERRGADVTAIDPNQGNGDNIKGFTLAHQVLESDIQFWDVSIEALGPSPLYDITFLFGTIYHVDDPLRHLQILSGLTKDYALIETAVIPSLPGDERALWEFNPGKEEDVTNKWYPTVSGLVTMLKYVGFKDVELIYNNGHRCTMKAIRNCGRSEE